MPMTCIFKKAKKRKRGNKKFEGINIALCRILSQVVEDINPRARQSILKSNCKSVCQVQRRVIDYLRQVEPVFSFYNVGVIGKFMVGFFLVIEILLGRLGLQGVPIYFDAGKPTTSQKTYLWFLTFLPVWNLSTP